MKLLFQRFTSALAATYGLGVAFGDAEGDPKARLKALLETPDGQRHALALLRFARPRLTLKANPVRCYPAQSALLLSRADDFHACIARQADFEVVYGARMRVLTGGRDFFLGLQDGPDYRRDTAAMQRIVHPGDLAPVLAMARREAAAAVTGTEIDLPPDLSAKIPAMMVRDWFGVDQPLPDLIADSTAMFHYLFSDLSDDPTVTERAMAARDRTGAAIAASMATAGPETLLGRAVAAGKAGDPAFDPAFDDAGIRANILGILIGAVPTLSKAACLAVAELLRRPAMLAAARERAQAGDEAGVATYLWEALRFSPVNPILYRRAARDTMIGDTPVAAGTMLLASNLSASFDEAAVPDARAFRPGRPWETYLPWGEGLHRCWGDRINRAILPAMLTPLLARDGLRPLARPDGAGTPFFRHFRLAMAAP